MRLEVFIAGLLPLFVLDCSKTPAELSDECKQIIESDSFYYALPLLEGGVEYDPRLKLDIFLTTFNDHQIQTIDFDCVIAVDPTNEMLDDLQRGLEEDFDERVSIATKHMDAAKCITESKGIKFVKATGQLIRLKTARQTWDFDMAKYKFVAWKFILFKNGKDPVILPDVSLTIDEIDEYFGL
jgi:hypothetical protein